MISVSDTCSVTILGWLQERICAWRGKLMPEATCIIQKYGLLPWWPLLTRLIDPHTHFRSVFASINPVHRRHTWKRGYKVIHILNFLTRYKYMAYTHSDCLSRLQWDGRMSCGQCPWYIMWTYSLKYIWEYFISALMIRSMSMTVRSVNIP
jgi:hypothetical protein